MKLATISLLAATLVAAGSAGAVEAVAAPAHSATTLRVVMHDPGCHWFFAGGKFTKTASASGPVKVANYDEAALKASNGSTVHLIPVGKSVVLKAGRYVITMVGQAPDDNHLKLTVR
jgi:hypothetical protein